MALNAGTSAPGRSGKTGLVLASLTAIAFIAALAISYYTLSREQTQQARATQISSLPASLAELQHQARQIIQSGNADFESIRASAARIATTLTALPATATKAGDKTAAALREAWQAIEADVNTLLEQQADYVGAQESIDAITNGLKPATQAYERIVAGLGARGASAGQTMLASSQLIRLQQMTILAQSATTPSADGASPTSKLANEALAFTEGQQLLLRSIGEDSPEIRAQINDASAQFDTVAQAATALGSASATVDRVQALAAGLVAQTDAALPLAVSLRDGLATAGTAPILPALAYAIGALAIVLLIAFIVYSTKSAGAQRERAEERDSRQQAAILSLLDEITNLADGDLTVDVTVTEDFTGAIADSINYTVDTLRRLVGTINNTAVEIAAAATSTQDTAEKMSQASERQAREVTSVANIITQTSQSLNLVASRAEQIAQEATNSVQIAHNGAATVGRTIQGMATLREQIQETAKRIKRLGESSQEIGNIIEFINDIAEQTNTLALNASIQAAMAGDAGRGFAVVADEVQRLAERVATSTRQVETLVKTIQADTNEAVISMERSTSNVIDGAKSAEEAGQALTKIESNSMDLARLIQEISASARSQSAQASQIAGQTQIIREIAVQTSTAAGQTAEAVGELTHLSEKLRESVAGFKLPTDVSFVSSPGFHGAA